MAWFFTHPALPLRTSAVSEFVAVAALTSFTAGGKLVYDITAVTPGTAYYVRVSAYNAVGTPASTGYSATTASTPVVLIPKQAPDAPKGEPKLELQVKPQRAAERAKAVQKMLFEEWERLSSSAAVAAQRLRRSRSMTLPTADRYAPSDSRQMSGKVWTDMGTVEYRMSSDLLEQMRSKARGPSPHRTQPSVAPSISPSPPPPPPPQPRPRYHEPLCPPLTPPLIPLPHPAAEGARPPSAPARQAAPPPLLYRRACRAARRRRCRAAAASFRRRRARGCSPRLAQPATCELDRAARVARRTCPIARGGRGGGATPSIPWAPSVPWRDA